MGLYFYKNHIRAWVAWICKVIEDFTAVPDGNMHAAELGEMLGEEFLDCIACFCYLLFAIGYEDVHFVCMDGDY